MATACLTWALMCVPGLALPQQDTDPPPSTQDDVGAGAESKPQVYTIIQGQVFDALGRGVAGSQIEIAKSDDSSVGGKVQSDSFGDFTLKLEGAHPGGFKIKITKSGFVQQVLDIQIEPEDLEPFVDVMLKGTLTIAGEVVEFLEHQPLMGAAVQLETLYRHAAAETDEKALEVARYGARWYLGSHTLAGHKPVLTGLEEKHGKKELIANEIFQGAD